MPVCALYLYLYVSVYNIIRTLEFYSTVLSTVVIVFISHIAI